MKRIFIVVAACLICVGTAKAGQLKIVVPVKDYKQMRAKMEALEKENIQLKQEVSATAGAAGGINQEKATALNTRINELEKENNQLKQAVNAGTAGSLSKEEAATLQSRLNGLEQENSQLQKQLADMQSQATKVEAKSSSSSEARLADLESENGQLKEKVRILKEGQETTALLGDKSTASELYAKSRHVSTFHNYVF